MLPAPLIAKRVTRPGPDLPTDSEIVDIIQSLAPIKEFYVEINKLKTAIKELKKENDDIRNENTDIRKIEPVHQEEREGDVKHSKADISNAEKLLKFHPKIKAREGLKNTVDQFIIKDR